MFCANKPKCGPEVAGSRGTAEGAVGVGRRAGEGEFRCWPLRCRLIMSLPVCSVKMTPEMKASRTQQWAILISSETGSFLGVDLWMHFLFYCFLKATYAKIQTCKSIWARCYHTATETKYTSSQTPHMQTAECAYKSRTLLIRAWMETQTPKHTNTHTCNIPNPACASPCLPNKPYKMSVLLPSSVP